MTGLSAPSLVVLAVFGLVGGVGISAVGPGGVLPTIGLFALTDLSPAEVAGTAIVTHVATGALGTAVYGRSGQLRERRTVRVALVLVLTAVVGTPVGVLINSAVSKRVFGIALGVIVALVAALLWYREQNPLAVSRTPTRTPVIAALGLVVSCASGIVGIGGPMLTVPLLVVLGSPVLDALAAAQVQSIVLAGSGAIGYVMAGAVNWPLAVLVGLPELVGVVVGWRIAHAVPTRRLKYVMVFLLLAVAPYLALHG